MEMETLTGALKAAGANLAAAEERVKQSTEQLVLSSADLDYCVVRAEQSGLVIYPTAEPWKHTPEIKEGATVYMGQTLLLMPDLSKMQVKVGIRESIVARIKPGLAARVALPDQTLHGRVSSVASVAGPASWWTGNVVRYDTIVELPPAEGLKPGMSAEVEVIVDRHEDVLTIPVAALVETEDGDFCWVKTADGAQRRSLRLGDTNDIFTIVTAGLKEGDKVLLNPLAMLNDAHAKALKPRNGAKAKPEKPSSDTQALASNKLLISKSKAD
jgi:multidrug efflux pump subunit AcrA (membrane-fusion protein)